MSAEEEEEEARRKGKSKMDEEINWVMDSIAGRISALKTDEIYEKHKWMLFSMATLSAIVGSTFLMRGLALTPLFDRLHFNIVWISFSGPFYIPYMIWFKFLFFPESEESKKRHRMRWDRQSRRKKNFFNDLVEDARKANADPPRKIRVLAHIRKILENNAGIPIERQLIRYREDNLVIDLRKNLFDREYGLIDGCRLHVYCKGGFTTQDSPIRKQWDQIRFEENKMAFEFVDNTYKAGAKELNVFDHMKTVATFLATRPPKSGDGRRSRGSSRGGTADGGGSGSVSMPGTAGRESMMNGDVGSVGSLGSSMAGATRGSSSIQGSSIGMGGSVKSINSGGPGDSKKVSFRS